MKLWDLYLEAKKDRKFYLATENQARFIRKKIHYIDIYYLVDENDNKITRDMSREFITAHLKRVLNGRLPNTI